MSVIEIEVDNPRNGQMVFLPLGRSLRGKFDPSRDGEPQARLLLIDYPSGVPGQRLGINPEEATAWIADGLHDDGARVVRDKLKAKGFQLPPAREDLPLNKADVPTWLYWIKRSVEAGIAKLVQGKLPDKIEGKIRKTFVSNERQKDPRDKQIERLTALLFAKLTPVEKKSVQDMLASTED